MKKWVTTIGVMWVFAISLYSHPIHVSLCNLEIEKAQMSIAVKVFLDDFQLALQHNYGKIIPYEELGSEKNKKLVDEYMNAAIQIVLNKSDSLRLSYDRTEKNEESIWFYFSSNAANLKEIDIRNMLLLDIYLDQTNLVIVQFNGKQSGYRFTSKEFEKTINLK